MLADGDDGIEVVGFRAKRAAARGLEGLHGARERGDAAILSRVAAGAGDAARCAMTSPLNRAGKKHRFGKAWMHEHVTDPYVREATRRGYRSRAAFKLMELDARDRFLRPGQTVVDLGAAPGSWSQVLRERLGTKATIVAIDLLPMDPIAGVTSIDVDFERDDGLAAIDASLAGRPVDLVLSDMSPNLTGIDVVDQARSIALAELALHFAGTHLRPGGDFVVKVFQGAGLDAFEREVRARFTKTYLRKPKASRDRSREHYVVAKGFRGSADARPG
jgi:23S rRNA (uridine2552-2'-O)-methyltransferase